MPAKHQMEDGSLLIDFVAPTSLLREPNRISALPVIGNGPPGTFVLFPNGLRVSLPTDQIVFADDTRGHARVGFGGMRFVGSKEGRLVFVRIRELFPEDQLSPDRSHTMLLDPQWVATISVDGRTVWHGTVTLRISRPHSGTCTSARRQSRARSSSSDQPSGHRHGIGCQRDPRLAASPPGAHMTSVLAGGPSEATTWFTMSGGLT